MPFPQGCEGKKGWSVIEDAVKDGKRPIIDSDCPPEYAQLVMVLMDALNGCADICDGTAEKLLGW